MNYDSVPLRDFKELNDWETVIFVYQSALKQVETKIDILNGEFQIMQFQTIRQLLDYNI